MQAFLHFFVPQVYAQASITPTVTAVPNDAYQVLANIMASIQTAIYAIIPAVLPYALPLLLLFLAIGVGLAIFNRFRHG